MHRSAEGAGPALCSGRVCPSVRFSAAKTGHLWVIQPFRGLLKGRGDCREPGWPKPFHRSEVTGNHPRHRILVLWAVFPLLLCREADHLNHGELGCVSGRRGRLSVLLSLHHQLWSRSPISVPGEQSLSSTGGRWGLGSNLS